MALTATAQSALPSWDETIVPALRKRLEGESRTLSKRMSHISLASQEDLSSSNFRLSSQSSSRERGTSPSHSNSSPARTPEGRPKMQRAGLSDQSFDTVQPRDNGSSSKPRSFHRPRTLSTPYSFDPATLQNDKVNGRSSTSKTSTELPSQSYLGRPTEVKPTRIPVVVRGRNGSVSSHGHAPSVNGKSPSLNGHNPYAQYSPDLAQNLWAVQETDRAHSNHSIPSATSPGLLNEPPPFSTATSSNSASYDHSHSLEDPPRASMESEERPFEHWYRGEVSRNGGVGELRVGKRMEMLDIANYGHSLRNKLRSPITPRDAATSELPRGRKRADSLTRVGHRDSLYLDENVRSDGILLDEHPLTDLDGEIDTDNENIYDSYFRSESGHHGSPSSPVPPSSLTHEYRSTTPTPNNPLHPRQTPPPTRIPGPSSRTGSEPSSTLPQASSPRGASEPTSLPSTSSPSSQPRSLSPQQPSRSPQPPSLLPTPIPTQESINTANRRAKSPAAAAPMNKKAKAKQPPVTKNGKKDDYRRSIANYPAPEDGDDMENAIPSWTEPVPKSGNWDEVVLPVVARKKGLDGQYERADGSPRPKKPQTDAYEPAPGTFGYDGSKYRQPEDESIPMDEFGQRPTASIAESQEDDTATPPVTEDSWRKGKGSAFDETPVGIKSVPSDAPFSQYAPNKIEPTRKMQERPPERDEVYVEVVEEKGAGCCKCVIM